MRRKFKKNIFIISRTDAVFSCQTLTMLSTLIQYIEHRSNNVYTKVTFTVYHTFIPFYTGITWSWSPDPQLSNNLTTANLFQ